MGRGVVILIFVLLVSSSFADFDCILVEFNLLAGVIYLFLLETVFSMGV